MNANDKGTDPATDLTLSLGDSNQLSRRRVSDDSGAGANAGSRLDMTFVATSPLSELVWSPHRGLCLKCADGSICENRPSLLWNVGPSNMVGGASTEQPFIEENAIASAAAFNLRSEFAGGENSMHFRASDAGIFQISESNDELRKDEPACDVVDNNQNSEKPTVKEIDFGIGNQTTGMELVLASEACKGNEHEASNSKVKNATSPEKKVHEESSSFVEKLGKDKMDIASPALLPLERLESTAENEMSCHVASKNTGPDDAREIKSNSHQEDVMLPGETCAVKQSPSNSRNKSYQMKGKAKALSDGNVKGKRSNEDESHGSVESCNSAELSSSRKKRWRSEPELNFERKSAKMQFQQGPGSSSVVKHDSSFMNWISNMMKGFLKSNQDEVPSHALTLGNCDNQLESRDQKLITCNKNQGSGCKTMGFQSIFQSLYCPKMKPQENIVSEELNHKTCDLNASPIACHAVTGDAYKQFLNFDESVSGNGVAQPAWTKDMSKSIAIGHQEMNRSNSNDNKNSYSSTLDKDKDGTGSKSCQDKSKRTSAENTDSEPASEGKTAHNVGYQSDPLSSLWITRFTSKASATLLNQDPTNNSTGEPLNHSTNGMRLKLKLHSDNRKVLAVREHPADDPMNLENCGADVESSFGLCKAKDLQEENSMSKVSPFLPSPRSKSSEAMASIFARRLDALKHNLTSTAAGSSSRLLLCFFCGTKGHHLRDCPEVMGNELEDLLRIVKSYDLAGELPSVCIRCFQHNHWAVTCPNASRRQGESSAYSVDKIGPSKLQLNAINADNSKLSDGSGSQLQAADELAVCNVNDPRMDKNLNLNRKLNEVGSSKRVQLNCKEFEKDTVPRSKKSRLEVKPSIPLSYIFNDQISEVRKGIFDAVKRLRLSRADVLKWMNSVVPFSQIDGLFLRLRLGKWEEGLGGTGYYVACISGVQRGSSALQSRNSISVDVGGMKCLVGSQYVSNHDFLEDELMAWWSATLRTGGKIPSEEDLRLKLKDKKALGF
ncbi:hypothetical protein Tsubulata_011017 [Turnera subulata]|uniref:CCHC-type domain-containing protein n=1 Tax=Turnera subulata TaxID=218843 RepID=A0A9Q0G9Y3_9ROSI|nr:hypothetical protein Tsubulata_011017 [Turnera subulata]